MNDKTDITVLITAAGNVFMPGTTKCFRENGERNIRLIGADMNDDRTILDMFDAYYQVPRGDDPRYIDALLEICIKENVNVIIPIMSVELYALSQNRRRFERIGVKVSVSDISGLIIANNKLRLMEFLRDSGLPCAKFTSAKTVDSLAKAAYALGYPRKPICIKAVESSGSRGFRILDETVSRYEALFSQKPTSCYTTLPDVIKVLSERETIPELVVMEYLPGKEYTVDLLADHGKVLYCCCRKSLTMDNSIMLDGVIVENEYINDLCTKVVGLLSLDGNIGFDIRESHDGIPYILECNPRATAGIAAFKAAGVNLLYLCVKKLLGEKLPQLSIKAGIIMKRRWTEMYCEPEF